MELREKICDGAAAGDVQTGGDLGKRFEDERTQMHRWMRQREFRIAHGTVGVGDEIEIDGARSPTQGRSSNSPEGSFDGVEMTQE